ncbi:hypothetical protein CRUP_013479, partial [Coryphaenoides rupestris]
WDRGWEQLFDIETLKQLLKLLPEKHEVENLRSYQGEHDKLADVDRFYLLLLAVPCYSLRIECMLLSEETSCLQSSSRLPSFCKLILDIGNFLNYGSHTGNAEGFKIGTLLKLTETKASKSRITLLHHVIEEAEKNHSDLLNLPEDLEICDKAAGVNVESIQSEAATLVRFLENTQKKVEDSSAEDLKENYLCVIEANLAGCRKLQELLKSIEEEKRMLAVYLCEDPSRLALHEVFSTLQKFRELFIKAYKENHSRKEQAVKVERRRKQQEEEEKKLPKGENGKPLRRMLAVQEEDCIVDNLLKDIRKGFCLRKTRHTDRGTLPPADQAKNSTQPDALSQPQGLTEPPQLPAGAAEPKHPSPNTADDQVDLDLDLDSVEVLSLSDLPQSPSPMPNATTPTAGPRSLSSGPDSGRESSPECLKGAGEEEEEEGGLSPGNPRPRGAGSEEGPKPSSQAPKGSKDTAKRSKTKKICTQHGSQKSISRETAPCLTPRSHPLSHTDYHCPHKTPLSPYYPPPHWSKKAPTNPHLTIPSQEPTVLKTPPL